MAVYTELRLRAQDGVTWVTIDSPPLNILGAQLMMDLDRLAAAAERDPETRVIVFQSADPDFFVAHGDMEFVDDPTAFAGLAIGQDRDAHLNPMLRLHERIRRLPQITIGKLAGLARGGGAELLAAMDMRFAATGRAGLGQFEVLTGIIPGAGATAYLPRLVGRARALEIVLGGDLIDAETAERYGWINRAVPPEDLDRFVDQLALRIAGLAPGVQDAAVAAVDAAAGPLDIALETENRLLGSTFEAPAAAELTRAAVLAGAQTRPVELQLEHMLHHHLPSPRA